MDLTQYSLFLYPSLVIAAVLYSSVGHGGASGYLAVMVLFGFAPDVMRPVALCMNVAVTSWLLLRHRENLRQVIRYVPLMIAATPAAFVGGAWQIESTTYKLIVGVILLFAALRMFWPVVKIAQTRAVSLSALVASGVGLGLLAGLTGVGGGIFLSPFLVVMGWSSVKDSIVPVAAFIWFNSVAGMFGFVYSGGTVPDNTGLLVGLAFVGALLGAEASLRQRRRRLLAYLLAVVLLIAAIKMIALGLA